MKWRALVSIHHESEARTITVEAKTAEEADRIFNDWFCHRYPWGDYDLYSDWERVEMKGGQT